MLEGRTALVTGGSRGIGRAICVELARMGARVLVNYVGNEDAAAETLSLVREAGGDGAVCRFDVADTQAVEAAVKELAAEHGPVTVLVNNAGITRDALTPRIKEADWDAVLDTNLKGAFTCSKAVLRAMMKARWGRIVNIGSVIGALGNAGQANYAAAKAGLAGLTRALAREVASRGITVNCVAPGYIVTDMTSGLSEEITEAIRAQIPLGELGRVEDVAAAVAYLVGPGGRYVTGQVLHVNGGMYMGG